MYSGKIAVPPGGGGIVGDYIGLEFSCFLSLMFYHKEKLRSSQKKVPIMILKNIYCLIKLSITK
jgi:hypothetical protein